MVGDVRSFLTIGGPHKKGVNCLIIAYKWMIGRASTITSTITAEAEDDTEKTDTLESMLKCELEQR